MIPGIDERLQQLWAECIEAVERGDHRALTRAQEELARLKPPPVTGKVRPVERSGSAA